MIIRLSLLSLVCMATACTSLQRGTTASADASSFETSPTREAGPARFVEQGPFPVAGLPDQRLTIWLPPGYDSSDRTYPVLYMHDGHNLFDPAHSNFKKVWAVDRAVAGLVEQGLIEPHIVVGIWAPGQDRYRQYLPAFAAEAANGIIATKINALSNGKPVVSERYLEWLADELKPMIDATYRTRSGPRDTAIAGSSMGGLMSCYAILERPDIFGRAACISSHWPIMLPDIAEQNFDQVSSIWDDWLEEKLGQPEGRRIWMDHGTATLDQYYAPYQQVVDQRFAATGWQRGTDWHSEVYAGAEHEENAWAARLPEILQWVLAPE